jgi:predicted dehydrogenase
MTSFNRRDLLRTAAAITAAAASYKRVLGANDRVRVANIGCGRRGLLKELLLVKDAAQSEVVAVCDLWKQKLDKAAFDVKEATGREPAKVSHYQDVLSRNDIDAVVIGTPDFQHCTMLIDAIRAGKDVYIEKPLAMNMEELNRAYDVVKKSDRIVQIGTQMRSYPQANGTHEFLKSGGLGKVLKVEQVRNGYSPYWRSFGGSKFMDEKPAEQDVDWKAFLMNHKARGFNADAYQNWYGYHEFSGGPHTNLMVHFIDLVHFVTDASIPKRVVTLGGTYRWKDQFDVPDSVEVALEYPEGFLVRYCTVFGNSAGNYAKWFGTRGTLDAKNLSTKEHWIANGDGSGETDKIASEVMMAEPPTTHHMQNFLECVRTRKQPIAPIEAGYAHSVAVIMADEALRTGRRMTYDAANRSVTPA